MYTDTLIKIFRRDLNKLKLEILAYKIESNLWVLDKSVSNSAGNLCLHLVGNLNHFIGFVIGKTGYIRQRDLEFSQKDVPIKTLLAAIDETILMIEEALGKLNKNDLEKPYPNEAIKEPMTYEYFLTHLVHHLSYHLGQINYHRRLLDL